MIPVIYDNINDMWTKADANNISTTWYNYDTQIWANAVTVTSATRDTYTNATVGTQIPMSDILGMWVWIPRYEYMFNNLGTSYAGGTQSLPGGISIKFLSGTSTISDSGYIIHPVFRNGSNIYNIMSASTTVATGTAAYHWGGWDKELTGFWMGKFEVGYANNNTNNAAISSNILVKPDLYSMRNQKILYQFTTAANIQSDHGIGSTVETHMAKNDEWGAVTYLSQSAYGKYGNTNYVGANKEVYKNNAVDSGITYYLTGRSCGIYGGGSGSGYSTYGTYEYNNCPAAANAHTNCTESVRNTNETMGTGASTTGNIYGIYDMSGGAYEYVMLNYKDTLLYSGFSSMPSAKYYNKITADTLGTSACNGTICYGQALSETNNGYFEGAFQWYNDGIYSLSSSYPWGQRGNTAYGDPNVGVGVFSANYHMGGAAAAFGLRAIIS